MIATAAHVRMYFSTLASARHAAFTLGASAVCELGFGTHDLECGVTFMSLGFRVQGSGSWVQGSGFGVQGLVFKVLRLRVKRSGLKGVGLRPVYDRL